MAIPAGTLEIKLIADVARLQKDMRDAQRALGAAETSFTQSGARMDNSMRRVTVSAGQQRAGMQQLSYQIGDVATQFALGANPMMIFAAQGNQVVNAIGLMRGSAGGLVGFLTGPWGAAFMGAVTVGGMLVSKLFEAEDAMGKVEWASYKLKDVQSILGGVMDMTTGKINTQSNALIALARAQILAGRAEAMRAKATARSELQDYQTIKLNRGARPGQFTQADALGMGTNFRAGMDPTGQITRDFLAGKLSPDRAVQSLERLNKAGKVSEDTFLGAMKSVTDYAVAVDNIPVFEEAQALLNGTGGKSLLDPTKPSAGGGGNRGGGGSSAVSEAARVRQQQIDASDQYIARLNDEIARIGKNEAELRKLEVAKALDAAATDDQRASIISLSAAREQALRIAEQQKAIEEAQKDTLGLGRELRIAEEEAKWAGITGREKERTLEKLKQSFVLSDMQAEIDRANADGNAELVRILTDQMATKQKIFAITNQTADQIAREAEEAQAFAEAMQRIEDNARNAGDALASAFDGAGDSLADVLRILTLMNQKQREYEIALAKASPEEKAALEAQHRTDALQATTAMIGAAKTLFKEQSAGYRAMEAAEKALAAVQAVNAAKSVMAGAAKMFGQAGLGGFPAVAAMMAIMAALGFSGGNRGSVNRSLYADAMQARQGTGTVLGDGGAQSESISRALENMADNSDTMLDFNNEMVRYLRSINSNIGALTNSIARQVGAGGDFGANWGSKTSSSGLNLPIIGGLFSSTTTKELIDAGINFRSDELNKILEQGFIEGTRYFREEKTKTSSGLFGIGGGTETSYIMKNKKLDEGVKRQASMVVDSMYQSVLAATEAIGMGDMTGAFSDYVVALGKVSLKGLSGDEISSALEAVFSAEADKMAEHAAPFLAEYQKVGEGLFETLVRIADEFRTIDLQLESIGRTFGAVGLESLDARTALIELMGGLDAFIDQTGSYRQNFLTEAERFAIINQGVMAEIDRLGLSGVDTKDEFKAVINGIDLTTAAGRELYAAMMALAPSFAAVEDYQEAQAQQAADLAKSRAALEIELMRLQGDAAGALAREREIELAAMDESLRALQQEVYLYQDIADAKDVLRQAYERERGELERTIDTFTGFGDSLRDFRATIYGSESSSRTYRQSLIELMRVGTLAGTGDQTALGSLPDVGQTFLDAAAQNASTRTEYMRAVAMVARYTDGAIGAADEAVDYAKAQLEALETQVEQYIQLNESVVSVHDAIVDLQSLLVRTVPQFTISANVESERRDDERHAEQMASDRDIRERLDRLERLWRNLTRDGTSIAVTTDPDTPLQTEAAS